MRRLLLLQEDNTVYFNTYRGYVYYDYDIEDDYHYASNGRMLPDPPESDEQLSTVLMRSEKQPRRAKEKRDGKV